LLPLFRFSPGWSFPPVTRNKFQADRKLPGARKQRSEGEDAVHISARRIGKTTVFDLSGDIDFANSPKVRDSILHEIRESRTPRVVVNLSQVRYMDSSGVASLVEGLKASRDLGSRFILVGLSTSTRDVLQLSRLIKVFEVYDNEEPAMAS
jgi:anti-sigma B factor antagonist